MYDDEGSGGPFIQPRACKDCKHIRIHWIYHVFFRNARYEFAKCAAAPKTDKQALIAGSPRKKPEYSFCEFEREPYGGCKPVGQNWEPKD